MTEPVLSVSNLHVAIGKGRNASPILRGVDLTIPAGKVLGLVGESGGGKTMVGKAITGLLPLTARVTGGSINFGDTTSLQCRTGNAASCWASTSR